MKRILLQGISFISGHRLQSTLPSSLLTSDCLLLTSPLCQLLSSNITETAAMSIYFFCSSSCKNDPYGLDVLIIGQLATSSSHQHQDWLQCSPESLTTFRIPSSSAINNTSILETQFKLTNQNQT